MGTRFALPLADKTSAQAVLLPTVNEKVWLVYSTPTGQIGLWTMTHETSPTPTPPIDPPSPPDPPVPPKPSSVSVITVSESTAVALPIAVAEFLDASKSTYHAFTIAMVSDSNPPPNALLWIGRTAGKTYPYSFVADQNGNILWEGKTPITSTSFLDLLEKFLTPKSKPRTCASGTCPSVKGKPLWKALRIAN
jgi:hypothetical protein